MPSRIFDHGKIDYAGFCATATKTLMGNQKIESVSTVLNEKFKTAKEIAR
jgi:hypothetical protein